MMKGPEEREEKTDRRKWSTAMMLGKKQNLEFKNLRQITQCPDQLDSKIQPTMIQSLVF